MPNSEKVQNASSDKSNEKIRAYTLEELNKAGNDPEKIDARLKKLSKEWDFEKFILCMAAFAVACSLTVGYFVMHRAFIVTGLVSVFLVIHVLFGWAPPIIILRWLKVLTEQEINNESLILKLRKYDLNKNLSAEQILDILEK